MSNYRFCKAASECERERVHLLNYEIFVEEIHQYGVNPERRLIDRFHPENCYFQCWLSDELVGMVCTRDKPPLSLQEKLIDFDKLVPTHTSIVEIRLLAVKRQHRTPQVFSGLTRLLKQHCAEQAYDLAVVSAFLGQMTLYRHIGFLPFGPVVGRAPALFQPMFLTLDAFAKFVVKTDHLPTPRLPTN